MRTNNIYRWNQTTFHLSLIFFNAVSYVVSFDNHESELREYSPWVFFVNFDFFTYVA